jgi:prevent-host-death family protein
MGVREAKDQWYAMLKRVANGEEIVITRYGKPIAMVVPYKPVPRGRPFRPDWELLRSLPMTPDSAAGIRAERDTDF